MIKSIFDLREFLMIYKKITFLIFSTIHIDITIAANILLGVDFMSLILKSQYKPFIISKINKIDMLSNFASISTIFVGNIFIGNTFSIHFRLFLFLFLIIVNSIFLFYFTIDLLILFIHNYYEIIHKFSPKYSELFKKGVLTFRKLLNLNFTSKKRQIICKRKNKSKFNIKKSLI